MSNSDQQPVVCVFCGHRPPVKRYEDSYKGMARTLSAQLIDNNFAVLTGGGGGDGIMAEVTKTARHKNGKSWQIIPDFLLKREGIPGSNDDENDLIRVVPSMVERKRMMFDISDVFILTFGGIGSLDEFFEILTAIQLGLVSKNKAPIIVFNHDQYWNHLQKLLQHMIELGFLPDADQSLFRFTDTVEETLALAQKISRQKIT